MSETVKNSDQVKNTLTFSAGKGKELQPVLKLEPNGRILWFVKGKEIIVKEKSLLAIALLDVFIQFTNLQYDYEKLDPELYKQYKEFLQTGKK